MFLFLVNLLFVNSIHVGKLSIEKSDNFPPTPTVASEQDVMPVEPLTRVGPCTEDLVGRTVPINQLEDGIQVLHFDYRGGPWFLGSRFLKTPPMRWLSVLGVMKEFTTGSISTIAFRTAALLHSFRVYFSLCRSPYISFIFWRLKLFTPIFTVQIHWWRQ
jgi:hypothetical protein